MKYLEYITSDDLDLLIKDLELIQSGFELNYVIDAGDVLRYAFPYGLKFNLLDQITPDDVGDILISYEYIFRHYRPIILNEYKLELILKRNTLRGSVDKRLQKDIFTTTTENDYNSAHLRNQIEKSATFLLATALMQNSMVDIFDDVYSNKLQIDSFKLKNNNRSDEILINNCFKNTKRSNWSEDVFIKWVEEKEDTYVTPKLIREYKNTLNDFIAIDRLCQINNKLQGDQNLNGKYIFLYFSGAKKSSNMFKLKEVQNVMPSVDKFEHYNLLRTPKHSYLLFLIYDKDIEVMKRSLQTLKVITRRGLSVASMLRSVDTFPEHDRNFFIDIQKMRRNMAEFKSIAIQVKKHKKFQIKLKKKIHKLKLASSDYLSIYKSFHDEAREANENISFLQIGISYLLQDKLLGLVRLLTTQDSFYINKGSDKIKGAYHHLPILLFVDQESIAENENVQKLLLKLNDFIIQNSEMRDGSFERFISEIKEIYYDIEETDYFSDGYDEILLKVLIFLVIEKAKNVTTEAFEFLENVYTAMKADKKAIKVWERDYLYVMIWVSRRVEAYAESKKYCEIGISRFPRDPRFYHGKSLYLYNEYFSESSLDSCNIKQLKEILNLGESALYGYRKGMTARGSFRKEYFDYIKGNISALNNLILYCVSLYYLKILEEGRNLNQELLDNYSLENLRKNYLVPIKTFEHIRSNPDKTWAEYSHTEAVLELVEGIFDQNLEKLNEAQKAIENSLIKDSNSVIYLKTESKIKSWKSRLSL